MSLGLDKIEIDKMPIIYMLICNLTYMMPFKTPQEFNEADNTIHLGKT